MTDGKDKFNNPKRFLTDPMVSEYSKPLPQAVDIEEVVLGALLLEKGKLEKVVHILKPEVFYKEENRMIFRAIQRLSNESRPADILMVTEQLRSDGELELVGGPYYITTLTNRVVSSGNIEWHIRILQQKFMRRELIRVATEVIHHAYKDTIDVFDLLDKAISELEHANQAKAEKVSHKNTSVVSQVRDSLLKESSKGIQLFYQTRWKSFDTKVISGSNKIILVAGPAKSGKTRWTTMWMAGLLEEYKDIAINWITLEDSSQDIVMHYLSSKVFVKGKDLKKKNFNPAMIPVLQKYLDKWSAFDIDFIDQSIYIKQIAGIFKVFCERRPEKFNILVIDNILSLEDRTPFKNDLNGFYDYCMNEILKIRQTTQALIIVVHHFKDAQQDKENLKDGFRPRLIDIKGTEAFRRVPNQVLLINTPGKYKDLLAEYKGERKENLKKMFIIDVGASREDDNIDADEGLVHMFASLDYNIFKEVEIPVRNPI